ncbi:docking protein 5-like [Lingula anatina]|uniref:Docking protein 5-like n=1 Tax=Lingula anatina TaxID=7574 RepID=A0A1S3HHT8_LINAN|nr:docking protein 5-like [Lingula anatina]|eukprot:XP_013385582.1 docking protein 5-like [Lingula anatina]
MSINYNDIVRQGYVKMKSKHLGRWIKRWVRLHRMSSKGHNHLEKYLNEDAAKSGAQHKIIDLKDVKAVERLPQEVKKHGVEIKFNDESSRLFCCGSDLEATEWIKALEQLCLGGVPNISLGEPDILEAGMHREMSERFHVYLLPAANLDICGECLLQVTLEKIILWDVENPRKKLVEWPVSALRRYGGDSSKFTFEAGRHCKTGEGVYVVNTVSGEEIYTRVNEVARAIALSARHRHTAPLLPLDREPVVHDARFGMPRSHSLPPPPHPSDHNPTGLSGYIHPPGPSNTLPAQDRRQHSPADMVSPLGRPYLCMRPLPKTPGDLTKTPEEDENIGAAAASVMAPPPLPEYMNIQRTPVSDDDDDDYVPYEQRGLNPDFRHFLSQRQSYVNDNQNGHQIKEDIQEEQL